MAKKAKQFTEEDDSLLSELGVETKVAKATKYTAKEERIIAGFEEIQRFVEEHGRLPQHGEDRDIFERLYAVRLEKIRESEECTALLQELDVGELLKGDGSADSKTEPATDDELLAALGVENSAAEISQLQHVRSRAEVKAAEEVAKRTPCEDFEDFRPAFEELQEQLKNSERKTARFQNNAELNRGEFFILEGQKVLIADMGDEFVTDYGRKDRRLRVIYDNGTESDLLLRSLQRALYKDENGRRILAHDSKTLPLFTNQIDEEDAQSGFVYVLRSCADHPYIEENRHVIHKIGVTGQELKKRFANTKRETTFLLADVEIVASYTLANVNRNKLEKVLHKFFGDARIDVQLRDRFNGLVEPQEWFLVPFDVVDRAMTLLMSGEIEHCKYDPNAAVIIDQRTGEPIE